MHSEKNIGEVNETIENRKTSLEEKSGYMNLDLTNTTSDILEYSREISDVANFITRHCCSNAPLSPFLVCFA